MASLGYDKQASPGWLGGPDASGLHPARGPSV